MDPASYNPEREERDYMLALGERLRQARESLGLTQEQAAVLCDVTKRSIQNWERGQNKMSARGLMGLAKGLRVSSDWLLGLSQSRSPMANGSVTVDEAALDALRHCLTSEELDRRNVIEWRPSLVPVLTRITERTRVISESDAVGIEREVYELIERKFPSLRDIQARINERLRAESTKIR